MQLSDVGVIKACQRADFADKPRCQTQLVGDQVWKHYLHRLNAVRNYVSNLVDLPHAAYPQHADDLVIAYPLTYLKSHQITSGSSASNDGAGGILFVSPGPALPCMGSNQTTST